MNSALSKHATVICSRVPIVARSQFQKFIDIFLPRRAVNQKGPEGCNFSAGKQNPPNDFCVSCICRRKLLVISRPVLSSIRKIPQEQIVTSIKLIIRLTKTKIHFENETPKSRLGTESVKD